MKFIQPSQARLSTGVFSGKIINRENIGKTSEELVAKWNTDHADDLVTVTG